MKNKNSRRKSVQSGQKNESNVSPVVLIVVALGIIWGVGYLFGHEILKYSKLTSVLLAPAFCLLLVVVFWIVNNL